MSQTKQDQAPPAPDGCAYGPWWDDEDQVWLCVDNRLFVSCHDGEHWCIGTFTEELAVKELLRLARENDAKTAFILKTIELYGTRSGPWNIPSQPGLWLHEARGLVGEPTVSHEESIKEIEE